MPLINGDNSANTIAGTDGADTIFGFQQNDSLGGSAGADQLDGGEGADTIIANGADTVLGGNGGDLVLLSGGGNNVAAGNGTDIAFFNLQGSITISGSLVTDSLGNTNTVSGVEQFRDSTGTLQPWANGTFAVCFAAGTRILTARGEVPVEALRPGDPLVTLGRRGAPIRPLRWVGRRRLMLAGHPHAQDLAPVRIRAGALGPHTPHRDLVVSQDHCLYLDGALVPARLLVDGKAIQILRGLSEVTYYHLELDAHDVLIAEGAAAESWLDTGNRVWFENARVALLQVDALLEEAGAGFDAARACAPLLQGGPLLGAIRDEIALRALEAEAAPAAPVALSA